MMLQMQTQMQTQILSVNSTLVNLWNQISKVADAEADTDADADMLALVLMFMFAFVISQKMGFIG